MPYHKDIDKKPNKEVSHWPFKSVIYQQQLKRIKLLQSDRPMPTNSGSSMAFRHDIEVLSDVMLVLSMGYCRRISSVNKVSNNLARIRVAFRKQGRKIIKNVLLLISNWKSISQMTLLVCHNLQLQKGHLKGRKSMIIIQRNTKQVKELNQKQFSHWL